MREPLRDGAAGERPADLPRIVILATGGTIASVAASVIETRSYEVKRSASAIAASVAEAGRYASVTAEDFSTCGSEDFDDALLLALARRIEALLVCEEVDGIVVTHGTDTLEETAFFLDLTLPHTKPVVCVGAMRPASALGADGPLNLFHAIRTATAPRAAGLGVLVVMNERVMSARSAVKRHTTALDAFTRDAQALALLAGDEVRFLGEAGSPRRRPAPFSLVDVKMLPRVDIVFGHQSVHATGFEAALAAGARGIVYAAPGNGSMSGIVREAAHAATAAGAVVVVSSRIAAGEVLVKAQDRAEGIVAAHGFGPPKARILLMLALTQTRDRAAIETWFATV